MNILSILLGFLSGICFGAGVFFLFTGLRRPGGDRLHILFGLFSFAYSGAILTSILNYKANTLEEYLLISRWTASTTVSTLIFLLWFVAYYSEVRPKSFLVGLTASFVLVGVVAIFRENFIHDEILGLVDANLPWGETIKLLDATESIWEMIFFLSELLLIGFVIYACVRQFFNGERHAAMVLGLGLSFLIVALVFDIVYIDSGALNFIYLGDYGFLPLLILMGLTLSNEVVRNEEELVTYRGNLKRMIYERTAELESAHTQLLVQAQEAAVEEERDRLARDLHDVITQILFSINLIAMSLPRLWQRDPPMAERSTAELQRLTRGALADMRIMLRELRPHTIIETKLDTLITQLSDGIATRHDIPIDLELDAACNLPPDVHVAFYRIAQETMNNIAKHAEANQVSVNLVCSDGSTELKIRDDGRGFDIEEVPIEHMGLDIMRERAAEIGAALTIQSQPGTGTDIQINWEMPQSGAMNDER